MFFVDIEFNIKNADEKIISFNEIYTPIFEKKKYIHQTKGRYFNCSMP